MPPNKESRLITLAKAISGQLDLSFFLIETAPWYGTVVIDLKDRGYNFEQVSSLANERKSFNSLL